MATDKDTIYVDIDDEITGIIDKLKTSNGKVVALVLPKRASVFQSIVNMKLLKRAAEASKKNVVLITSEAGLLPLAGAAGVHVAKTLTSKPEIPATPDAFDETEEETVQEEEADALPDPTKSIGQLAGGAAAADGVETLVLDDEDVPPEADASPEPPGPKTFEAPTKPKNKKLRIPNFERFRLLLALGALLLVLLIGGFIFASASLNKATITIKTDATNVNASADLNLSTAATKLSTDNNTLPAKLVSQQKTYSQQVPTTGQKNNGNKASGTVTVMNCSGSDVTLPAGTGFSSGGNTFISQTSVTVPDSNYKITGECKKDGKADVDILAQNPGSAFNGATSFTVAGHSALSGIGSTSGGTDNIVQSVNQNDINNAKAKINTNDTSVKSALQSQLQQAGYYAIAATYSAGAPTTTNSANVGDVANNVTVTEVVTYTMFGAHKTDLDTVLDNNINSQIDSSKQKIQDNGLSKAVFNVNNTSPTSAQLSVSAKGVAGPDLNTDSVTQMAAGKKPGAIKDQLRDNPDVTSVDVKLSPFWVSTVPKNTKHIKVVIAEPTSTAKASSNGGGQ